MGKITYEGKDVFLVAKKNVSYAVKAGEELTVKIALEEKNNPIKKGEVKGIAEVLCNGEKIGETELVAEKTVKKEGFWEMVKNFFLKIFSK